jgi:hypothetical protein
VRTGRESILEVPVISGGVREEHSEVVFSLETLVLQSNETWVCIFNNFD